MKIAYIILAHNTPDHLGRLVNRLNSSKSWFFIHVDRKANIEEFAKLRADNLIFIADRIPVHWGDYSIVEATLTLLRAALLAKERFARVVLLSGADYPICTTTDIEKFFERAVGNEFIDLIRMPNEELGKPISRLNYYVHQATDGRVSKFMVDALDRLTLVPKVRDHKLFLGDMAPYAGSQWWALTHEASAYIIDFISKNPDIPRFYRNTLCPDESLFHTIIGNSPYGKKSVGSITYADWTDNLRSPALISHRHLDALSSMARSAINAAAGKQRYLFARKFPDRSDELIEELESRLESF